MVPNKNHLEVYTLEELTSFNYFTSLNKISSSKIRFIIAILIFLLLFLFLSSLVFLPWVQTVNASGKVVVYSPHYRQQNLDSPIDGRIKKWMFHEGQKVNRGDLIIELEDIDPNIMDRLIKEKEATEQKLKAAIASMDVSNSNFKRQKALWEKGLSSKRAYELSELEYSKFLSEKSSVSAELARLETKISRQSSQSVFALTDGIIQEIYAPQGGALIKKGQTLAKIVPSTSDRAVELFISGNDIPLISVGREVRLQFEGWPAVQFSGWPSVAVGTFAGTVTFVDSTDHETGLFRIIVFPKNGEKWPDARYLRLGIKVVGWVLLDTVSLGWEMWRKLNAFPLSIPSKTEEVGKS